jgi:hypothetical protein
LLVKVPPRRLELVHPHLLKLPQVLLVKSHPLLEQQLVLQLGESPRGEGRGVAGAERRLDIIPMHDMSVFLSKETEAI